MNHSHTAQKPLSPGQFRNFIFAGRAKFTLENKETGSHISFRVMQVKKAGKVIPHNFGVSCKAAGDKTYGYQFMGFLNTETQRFNPWKKTDPKFIGYKVFRWLLDLFDQLEALDSRLAIYHEGSCCKCGMPLTIPSSIETGIGPICESRMQSSSVKIMIDLGTYNKKISYTENVKLALAKNPEMWTKLHIPAEVELSKECKTHRMFDKLSIW